MKETCVAAGVPGDDRRDNVTVTAPWLRDSHHRSSHPSISPRAVGPGRPAITSASGRSGLVQSPANDDPGGQPVFASPNDLIRASWVCAATQASPDSLASSRGSPARSPGFRSRFSSGPRTGQIHDRPERCYRRPGIEKARLGSLLGASVLRSDRHRWRHGPMAWRRRGSEKKSRTG